LLLGVCDSRSIMRFGSSVVTCFSLLWLSSMAERGKNSFKLALVDEQETDGVSGLAAMFATTDSSLAGVETKEPNPWKRYANIADAERDGAVVHDGQPVPGGHHVRGAVPPESIEVVKDPNLLPVGQADIVLAVYVTVPDWCHPCDREVWQFEFAGLQNTLKILTPKFNGTKVTAYVRHPPPQEATRVKGAVTGGMTRATARVLFEMPSANYTVMWLQVPVPLSGNPPEYVLTNCHNGIPMKVEVPEAIGSMEGHSISFLCPMTQAQEDEEEEELQHVTNEDAGRCCCSQKQQPRCRIFKSSPALTKCPRVQQTQGSQECFKPKCKTADYLGKTCFFTHFSSTDCSNDTPLFPGERCTR